MRTLSRSVTLALALVGVAELAIAASPPVPAGRTIAPSIAMQRAAILSVYFHSHFATSDWLPPELQPIDLVEAAEILKNATGQMAESRRRRAIARLVVAGLDDPKRCQAAHVLDAPLGELNQVLSGLALASAAGGPAPSPAVASDSCRSGPAPFVVAREQAIVAIMVRLDQLRGLAIADCPYEFHPAQTAFDQKTWITTATVNTAVKRPLATVRVVMDPQTWDADDCSDFFTEVYAALKSGDDYVVSKDFTVAEDPKAPAAGSNYARELFEHFDVNFKYPYTQNGQAVIAWYKNLLGIVSQDLPGKAHLYKYSLFRSLGSSVYFDVRAGGLGFDDGEITLRPRTADPTWTELHLTKAVLFTDRPALDWYLNLWASISLEAMAEELPEMACCQP